MKLLKRAAALCMAAAMAMSLSVTAFAVEVPAGDLTVTGKELAGKNVFAVRMFTAVANETGDSYTFTDYELEEKWRPFFAEIDYSEYNSNNDDDPDITPPVDAKEALTYMEWLKNDNGEQQWAEFAEEAQDWLYQNNVIEVTGEPENRVVSIAEDWSGLAAMQKATEVEPVEVNEAPSGNATFASLTSGYYVVFPEGGSTGISNRGTDAMLINIPTDHAGATWNIKSTFPTVEKTVEDNNDNTTGDGANGSAQVGDTVTFTLTSAVPDMSDYEDFYFAFNDTLSNGLQFVQKTPVPALIDTDDVTVTIGGKTVTAGYSVSLEGKVLKIEFTDLKDGVTVTDGTVTTGAEIVVTYQAMITEAAVVGTPALNTVEVEYSNNPNTSDHGTSTPDESKVYTYAIDVNKWSSDMTTTNLAGAVFKLTTDEEGNNVVNLIATDETDSEDATDLHNAYRVAKPGEESEEGYTTTFTTDDDGNINIAGLEAGTYYLHEVTAPSGYNKLKDPITIVITMTDHTTGAATITVNGKPATGEGSTTVDVENKKGIVLPETGSIGTIGLTVAGVAIVLVGVFAPRKKKENQE